MGQQESVPAKEQVDSSPDVGAATLTNIKNEASDDNDDRPISVADTDLSVQAIKQEPPDEQEESSQLASFPRSVINLDGRELVRHQMEGFPIGNRQPINYDLFPKLDDSYRPEGMHDEEWELRRTIITNPLDTMDLTLLPHYGLPFVSEIPTNESFSSDEDDDDEGEETNGEDIAGDSIGRPGGNLDSISTPTAALSIRENEGVKKVPDKNPFQEALDIAKGKKKEEEEKRKRKEEEEERKEKEEEKRKRKEEEEKEEERRLRAEEERRMRDEKKKMEEEERRVREEEQIKARKAEEEKKRKEEEEKELRRIEEERKKSEEEKKRNEERLRDATRQEISSLEQDDTLSTKSDTTSTCNSEGNAALSNKQIAQRERRRREQEEKRRLAANRDDVALSDPNQKEDERKRQKADMEAARKLDEQMKREAEEEKLRKRRADTAAREAQEAREEEEARQRREMKRQKKEEEKKRKMEEEEKRKIEEMEKLERERESDKREREEEKKTEDERRKEEEKSKKRTIEEWNKSRVSMHDSDSDSPIKKRAKGCDKKERLLQKKRRNTIETSSDEETEDVPSSSAAPISHRSSSSSTPLPPSSTAKPGARGSGSTPLPPSLPKPSHEMHKKKKDEVNYAGRDARVSVNQLPKIPKKSLPTPAVPLVHPVSVPPTARSTPIGEQRKRAAEAATAAELKEKAAAAAALAARRSSDGSERKSTVKQPRSKLKPPPVSIEESVKDDKVGGIMNLMCNNDAPADAAPPPEKRVRMDTGGRGGGGSTWMEGEGRPGPSSALNVRTAARVLSASSRSPSFASPTYSSSPSNSPLYSQQAHQQPHQQPHQQSHQQQKAPPTRNPMVFESSFPRPSHPPGRSRRKESTTTPAIVPDSPSASESFQIPDLPDDLISPVPPSTTNPPSFSPLPHPPSSNPNQAAAHQPPPAVVDAAPRAPAAPAAASQPASSSSASVPSSAPQSSAASAPSARQKSWMPNLRSDDPPSSPAVSSSMHPSSSSSHFSFDPRLQSRQGGIPMDPRIRPPPMISSPLPSTSFIPSRSNSVEDVVDSLSPEARQKIAQMSLPSSSSNRSIDSPRPSSAGPSNLQSMQPRRSEEGTPLPTIGTATSNIYESEMKEGRTRDPRQCPRLARKVPQSWPSMEKEVVEWEERMEKRQMEKKRNGRYAIMPVEGIVWSEYKRLTAYRRADEDCHRENVDNGVCLSCADDTRVQGRKPLKTKNDTRPYTILELDSYPVDYEDVDAMKRRVEGIGGESSNARRNEDILATLGPVGGSSNEESNSTSNGQDSLIHGFDDGVLLSNVIKNRRRETNEERKQRKDFIGGLVRSGILVTAQDVARMDMDAAKEMIENEGGLENEFDDEWKKELDAWNESISAATSSNPIPSGTVAGSGGTSKVATEPKEDGGSSTTSKSSSTSSQKQQSMGTSNTPTIKVSKPDTRAPSTSSSSRPSDANKQRSRESTKSPRPSTSAVSPRMTSSTTQSNSTHILGLPTDNSTRPTSNLSNSTLIPGPSQDNSTRPISRPSNEENHPSSSSGTQLTSSAESEALDANFSNMQKFLRQMTGQDKQQPSVAPSPMQSYGMVTATAMPQHNPMPPRFPPPHIMPSMVSGFPQYNQLYAHPYAQFGYQIAATPAMYHSNGPPPFTFQYPMGIPPGGMPFPNGHPQGIPSAGVPIPAIHPQGIPSAGVPIPAIHPQGIPSAGVPIPAIHPQGIPSAGVPIPAIHPQGIPSGGVPIPAGPPSVIPSNGVSIPSGGVPIPAVHLQGIPSGGVSIPPGPPTGVPPVVVSPPLPPVIEADEQTGRENTRREGETDETGESVRVSTPEDELPSTSREEGIKQEEDDEDYWRAPLDNGSDADTSVLTQGCEPRPEPFIRAAEWPKTTYEEDCRTICVAKLRKLGGGSISIQALRKHFEQYAELEEIRIKRSRAMHVAFIRLKKHAQVSQLLHMSHIVDGSKLALTTYLSKATVRPL